MCSQDTVSRDYRRSSAEEKEIKNGAEWAVDGCWWHNSGGLEGKNESVRRNSCYRYMSLMWPSPPAAASYHLTTAPRPARNP